MGQSPSPGHVPCCSSREKGSCLDRGYCLDRDSYFTPFGCQVDMAEVMFVAVAPLHRRDPAMPRRLAVAGPREVRVYEVADGQFGSGAPRLTETHRLRVDRFRQVTALVFTDEDSSRYLGVAIVTDPVTDGAPLLAAGSGAAHCVQVFDCEDSGGDGGGGWTEQDGLLSSEGAHQAPITHLRTHKGVYVLTASSDGLCQVFLNAQGGRFTRRHNAVLHPSGIADISVDRSFAYSVGRDSSVVRISQLPELCQVREIAMDVPLDFVGVWASPAPGPTRLCTPPPAPWGAAAAPAATQLLSRSPSAGAAGPVHLARVGLLRRPCSRWCGIPAVHGAPTVPRGFLFVAGELAGGRKAGGEGAGVLMEWSLQDKPICQSAQIAHDTPIVLLGHGPYDNGPIITADIQGMFRVWESPLGKGLCFTQQLDLAALCGDPAGQPAMPALRPPALAVEQPFGLFVVAGDGSLSVWRRPPWPGYA